MATERPDAVRSLTLIETPWFGVAPDDEVVQDMALRGKELFANPTDDPAVAVRTFAEMVGLNLPIPDEFFDPRPSSS